MSVFQFMGRDYQNYVVPSQQPSDTSYHHNPDMDTLADRLKREREAQGLTQDALAKRVGRTKRQSLISNIEAGTYKSSPWLPEIAFALGLHAMWLKNGIGPKEIHTSALSAQEPPPPDYPTNVKQLPTENPLRRELFSIAERMSERGLQVLIYEAEKIDKLYPRVQQNHSS